VGCLPILSSTLNYSPGKYHKHNKNNTSVVCNFTYFLMHVGLDRVNATITPFAVVHSSSRGVIIIIPRLGYNDYNQPLGFKSYGAIFIDYNNWP